MPAMTTTPIEQPADDSSIPRWFHEFALANAAQHAALADRIGQVEIHVIQVEKQVIQVEKQVAQLETRIIRWVVGSAAAAVGTGAALIAAAAAAASVWG